MDWRAIKFDWNRARAFLVTAEEGSLSAAAKALGMAQPTLGRQVTALEKELGVTLFERIGRGLELTPIGVEVLDHVRIMGEAATSFSLSASGHSDTIEGNVCITATEVLAVYVLPALIVRLREAVPGIQIELIASNTESSLKRREADIAIRGYRPTQPDLITRKLRDVQAYLYATPEYLQSIGNPTSSVELHAADFIAFDGHERLVQLLNAGGFNLSAGNFPVTTENRIAQWELVKAGAGIGVMPREIGEAEPKVQRVLADSEPITAELWIASHSELKTNRRVRMVFDFLVSQLSQDR